MTFFQLDQQLDISLYLMEAIALYRQFDTTLMYL